MTKVNDLTKSLIPFEQDVCIVAVVELSQSSWLVAGIVPGIERQPRKKQGPDPDSLLQLLHRWRDEAIRKGARSGALPSRTRPDATDSGWRDGCGITESMFTSSIRRASRSRGSTGERRPIASTPPC